MLIHKTTLGVLGYVWTGTLFEGMPYMREARLADYPELVPEDWWELPANSPLGKRVLLAYPDFEPETDSGGMLVNIHIPADEEKERLANEARAQAGREAQKRGYRRSRALRPVGVLGFLNFGVPGSETKAGKTPTIVGKPGKGGNEPCK